MIFDKKTLDVELIEGKKSYRLLESLYGYDEETGVHVLVPQLFETDLASVPPIFRAFISNYDNRIRMPSIVHDWIYHKNGNMDSFNYCGKDRIVVGRTRISRVVADKIFYNGLRHQGVSKFKSLMMWLAVRAAGWRYWNG